MEALHNRQPDPDQVEQLASDEAAEVRPLTVPSVHTSASGLTTNANLPSGPSFRAVSTDFTGLILSLDPNFKNVTTLPNRGGEAVATFVIEADSGKKLFGKIVNDQPRVERVLECPGTLAQHPEHLEPNEVQALQSVSHPGLPRHSKAYDLQFGTPGLPDGSKLIVREFIEGESLQEMLERESTLPLDAVREITMQLLRILDYIHNFRDGQIVNGDIKPSNIIVQRNTSVDTSTTDHNTANWGVWLVDFGVARVRRDTDELTLTLTPRGTPDYMPREQLTGHCVPSSDLYALAITIYKAITGTLPFDNVSHWSDEKCDVPTHPLMPERLRLVLSKMLNADHLKRPQSAAEVIQSISCDSCWTLRPGKTWTGAALTFLRRCGALLLNLTQRASEVSGSTRPDTTTPLLTTNLQSDTAATTIAPDGGNSQQLTALTGGMTPHQRAVLELRSEIIQLLRGVIELGRYDRHSLQIPAYLKMRLVDEVKRLVIQDSSPGRCRKFSFGPIGLTEDDERRMPRYTAMIASILGCQLIAAGTKNLWFSPFRKVISVFKDVLLHPKKLLVEGKIPNTLTKRVFKGTIYLGNWNDEQRLIRLLEYARDTLARQLQILRKICEEHLKIKQADRSQDRPANAAEAILIRRSIDETLRPLNNQLSAARLAKEGDEGVYTNAWMNEHALSDYFYFLQDRICAEAERIRSRDGDWRSLVIQLSDEQREWLSLSNITWVCGLYEHKSGWREASNFEALKCKLKGLLNADLEYTSDGNLSVKLTWLSLDIFKSWIELIRRDPEYYRRQRAEYERTELNKRVIREGTIVYQTANLGGENVWEIVVDCYNQYWRVSIGSEGWHRIDYSEQLQQSRDSELRDLAQYQSLDELAEVFKSRNDLFRKYMANYAEYRGTQRLSPGKYRYLPDHLLEAIVAHEGRKIHQ